jgi:DUF1680 family protein
MEATDEPRVRGAVAPTADAATRLRPLGAYGFRAGAASFWQRWMTVNRETTLLLGWERMEGAGNFHNLRLAAGEISGEYLGPLYLDSDVYKWLEAAAWEQSRAPSIDLAKRQTDLNELVDAAQADDGYLNSYYQTHPDLGRFTNLTMGHELFCAGHLIQAAIAQVRATGDSSLLEVAVRFANYLVTEFLGGGRKGVPGHPEIEMALVELYRETTGRPYLDLAQHFIDARGHQSVETDRYGYAYYQDRVPIRAATTVEGHAVRALYLAAGAADVAAETCDDGLSAALVAQWSQMVSTKMYVTGGVGSRWEGEAFGDPYELPPDRAYCETCAAIASIQWTWRMLLLTGESKYGDVIERTMYNAVLPGLSLDGRQFFYVNPLQLRSTEDTISSRSPALGRSDWFTTACCPPNVMRFLSSIEHYFASQSPSGIQIHQYSGGEIRAQFRGGEVVLRIETTYPWDGDITINVLSAALGRWELALRIPDWCTDAQIEQDGETSPVATANGWLRLERDWIPGTTLRLGLAMPVRHTRASERIDATRGCVAIERGPLVYCTEEIDVSGGLSVDSLRLGEGVSNILPFQPDVLGGIRTILNDGVSINNRERTTYQSSATARPETLSPCEFNSVPYFVWANRGIGPMRVWLPQETRPSPTGAVR